LCYISFGLFLFLVYSTTIGTSAKNIGSSGLQRQNCVLLFSLLSGIACSTVNIIQHLLMPIKKMKLLWIDLLIKVMKAQLCRCNDANYSRSKIHAISLKNNAAHFHATWS
jgi:hypothetical protein